MEKLSAIAQISVLLIVAFLIGFVTAWMYYRIKNNNLKKRLQEKSDELEKTRKELEQLQVEYSKLQDILEQKEGETMKKFEENYLPEPLYSLIVKDMGEGVSVSNQRGQFLVFNPKLEQITGYTKNEANSYKENGNEELFLNTIYPDIELREKVAEHIKSIPENGDYTNIKTQITAKNNEKKPVLVSSTIVNYNQKKFYLTVYRDISKKPEVEA